MSLVSYYFLKSVATRKFKITYVALICGSHYIGTEHMRKWEATGGLWPREGDARR